MRGGLSIDTQPGRATEVLAGQASEEVGQSTAELPEDQKTRDQERGPIACQAIALKDFKRDFCGQWEMASHYGELRVLRPVLGLRRWGLPIALAVLPK